MVLHLLHYSISLLPCLFLSVCLPFLQSFTVCHSSLFLPLSPSSSNLYRSSLSVLIPLPMHVAEVTERPLLTATLQAVLRTPTHPARPRVQPQGTSKFDLLKNQIPSRAQIPPARRRTQYNATQPLPPGARDDLCRHPCGRASGAHPQHASFTRCAPRLDPAGLASHASTPGRRNQLSTPSNSVSRNKKNS